MASYGHFALALLVQLQCISESLVILNVDSNLLQFGCRFSDFAVFGELVHALASFNLELDLAIVRKGLLSSLTLSHIDAAFSRYINAVSALPSFVASYASFAYESFSLTSL